MVQDERFAFIFDMDGTLVDNMQVHNRIWIEFLTEVGGRPDPETFNDLTAGKTNPEIIRLFLGDGLTEAQVKQYGDEKEIRYRQQYREQVKPLPGAIAFLTAARNLGIAHCLATSAGMENVEMVLEGARLAEFFPTLLTAGDVQHGKPNPEIYIKASDRLGIPPERCLVFEDSRGGIEAAHRAGMRVVGITTVLSEATVLGLPGICAAVQDFVPLNPADLIDRYLRRANGR